MSLNFQNVRVLGYNQTSKFFGENFRYQNQASFTIEGFLDNITNDSGVANIQNQIDQFFSGDNDYQPVIVNGYTFGTGRILNISFPVSNDVRTKNYSIDITCYNSGNLFNLTGSTYSGLSSFDYSSIESFSENFTYNKNGQEFSYSHGVNVKMWRGAAGNNPIQLAQNLAVGLMAGNSSYGYLTSGENLTLGRTIYSETYDAITNQCAFSQNYTRPTNNSGLIYTLTDSFSRDEAGNATITENATVQSITGAVNPVFANQLWQTMDNLITSSFARASGVYNNYSGISYPLFSTYTSLSKNLNHFENKGSYSISYTNKSEQNSGFNWTYTNEITKNNQYFTITENGNIQGFGNPIYVGYPRAKSGYGVVKTGIYARSYSFYTGQIPYATLYGINLVSQSTNGDQFQGRLSYSNSYTDNPVYATNNPLIKLQEINIEDSYPVQLINKFNILSYKEIVQNTQNVTLGQRNININLLGFRDTNLSGFKAQAQTIFNNNLPSGTDPFLENINYSYNPISKNFTAQASWGYQSVANIYPA